MIEVNSYLMIVAGIHLGLVRIDFLEIEAKSYQNYL